MSVFLHERLPSLLQPYFGNGRNIPSIIVALGLGAVAGVALPASAKFLSWFRLYFLHRSKISRYHHSPPPVSSSRGTPSSLVEPATTKIPSTNPWALVTGASDGIGAGFVSELAFRGFNIILHGRNLTKIQTQITSLQQDHPNLQFEPWIADASDRSTWSTAFSSLQQLIENRGIHLTVLVNNVGGNPNLKRSFTPLSEYEETELNRLIDMNLTFPTQLTCLLLPQLSVNKPSLVLNMSSAVASTPIPYICGYAASKAFNSQFSKTLRLELVAEGHQEVDVLSVTAARVKSAGVGDIEVNWLTPTSRDFARSTIGLVGCGREEVVGWWSHAMQVWSLTVVPMWLRDWILVDIATRERQEWRKKN